ncbi:MAG: flagellar basal body rod protein FlgB [Firmicutes bacterium]|nr:flagellar basal body rod protein FlgB [Bacillota bacterium]
MLNKVLGGRALQALEDSLKVSSLQRQAIADNVANAETPGYKSRTVSFRQRLEQAGRSPEAVSHRSTRAGVGDLRFAALSLEGTHPLHMGGEEPRSQTRPLVLRQGSGNDASTRRDGNDVNLEREMTALARDLIWYQALTRQVRDRLGALRLAASEGKR